MYSIIEGKEKETLVYGTLAIVSLISFYQAYNLYGSITATGNNGSIKINFDNSDECNPTFDGKKLEEIIQEEHLSLVMIFL
ncbi:MAG: hypothetical protein IJD40_13775 [Lachnospiraceae bacterium]|nr:hypothetical protein [Lachnospiraceae bacterium]